MARKKQQDVFPEAAPEPRSRGRRRHDEIEVHASVRRILEARQELKRLREQLTDFGEVWDGDDKPFRA